MMPQKYKYECKICAKSFMHKETLDEHNYLHDQISHCGRSYSCPICQQKVLCKSDTQQHVLINGHNKADRLEHDGILVKVECLELSKPQQTNNENWNSQEIESASGGATSKRINRRSRTGGNELNASKIVSESENLVCEVCSKSFVYLKCLLKHRSAVHGNHDADNVTPKHDDQVISHVNGTDSNIIVSTGASVSSNLHRSVTPPVGALKAETESGVSENDEDADASDADPDYKPDTSVQKRKLRKTNNSGGLSEFGEKSTKRKESNEPDPSFKCKTCLKSFKYKTTLVRHLRVVHGGQNCDKCTCPICLQIFDNQITFSKHFSDIHKEKASELLAFQTEGDDFSTSSSESDNSVVRCVPCSQWFTCRRSLIRHSGLKHRIVRCPETGKVSFRCFHCGEMFSTEQLLIYHRHNVHYLSRNHDDPSILLSDSGIDAEKNINVADRVMSSDDETLRSTDTKKSKNGQRKLPPRHFCTECSKAFANVGFLVRHKKMKHGRLAAMSAAVSSELSGLKSVKHRPTFVCGRCSEEFTDEEALAQHCIDSHNEAMEFDHECHCPICGCSCSSQMAFSQHYQTSHQTADELAAVAEQTIDIPKCAICMQWFISEQFLQSHHCLKKESTWSVHTLAPRSGRRARYRCMQCGEAFQILRHFLRHRRVKHSITCPVQRKDKCIRKSTDDATHTTGSSPPSDVSMLVPPAEQSSIIPSFVRGRPRMSENIASTVQTSVPLSSNSGDGESPAKPTQEVESANKVSPSNLQCPDCSIPFSNISLLRKHRKNVHRNRTCQLCGETCKSADMVYYHNVKHHHEQKCDVCGASCTGRLGLIDHYRTTHPTEQAPLINRKTLICEYCPRVFASCASRLLRDHIESCHLGHVHLCDICGKRLGSAQTLAVHKRMHDPVARFACHDCNRRFPHNTNLINHIRKHHPERLPAKYVREYVCEICSLHFASSSGLARHRTEKHGHARHQCEECFRIFQSANSVRIHKRREHGPKAKEEVISSPVFVLSTSQPIVDVQSAPPQRAVLQHSQPVEIASTTAEQRPTPSTTNLLQFSTAGPAYVASILASLPGTVNIARLSPASIANLQSAQGGNIVNIIQPPYQ